MKTLEQKKQELRDLSNVGDLIAELASDLLLAIEALEKFKGKAIGVINSENPMRDIITFPADEALNKIIERE